MINSKTTAILTGKHEHDKHLGVGPDPHGAMCTGTGHSRAHVKHDPRAPAHKMKLTKEEQDIMDGKKGEVLAKVMKTVVVYGQAFGAEAGVASSDKGLKVNADGTIDIFFGPKATAGQEANSVPTTANANYWLFFRFYGPEPAVFTKSWQLPDLEEVR